MIGVIPCAGEGSRMGGKCKPLLKVKRTSIIEGILEHMKNAKCNKIYIIQNGKEIEKACGYDYFETPIEYIQQENQTGLLDAIKLMANIKTKEPMLVILGDIVYDAYDISRMCELGDEMNVHHAIVAYKKINDKNEIKKSYGFTSSAERPVQIIEKPTDEDLEKLESWLGLGIWVLKPEAFLFMKAGHFTEIFNKFPNDTLLFELEGTYHNINTEEDLENANNNSV